MSFRPTEISSRLIVVVTYSVASDWASRYAATESRPAPWWIRNVVSSSLVSIYLPVVGECPYGLALSIGEALSGRLP